MDRPLLLLDEPTEGVDAATESAILDRAVRRGQEHRTGRDHALPGTVRRTIVFDGADTRTTSGDEVRAHTAWCGPDTHLFDTTLRHHLLLARPDATDGDLRGVLRAAKLAAWLDGRPEGLNTHLGAHGTTLSGGERQRVGVTRAHLSRREIVLLDEPTAHLDGPTATALATGLATVTADRTTLIVTHHPQDFPTDMTRCTIAARGATAMRDARNAGARGP